MFLVFPSLAGGLKLQALDSNGHSPRRNNAQDTEHYARNFTRRPGDDPINNAVHGPDCREDGRLRETSDVSVRDALDGQPKRSLKFPVPLGLHPERRLHRQGAEFS